MTLRKRHLAHPCGTCPNLDPKPIENGLRYCWGYMTWRSPTDRVVGCIYRPRGRIEHELRDPWGK